MLNQRLIHHRHGVADRLEASQHLDQTERAQIGVDTIINQFDQMFDRGADGIDRGIQRPCYRSHAIGRIHALILFDPLFEHKPDSEISQPDKEVTHVTNVAAATSFAAGTTSDTTSPRVQLLL
ncbi:MAG: hypothetical protein QM650_13880 [Microlunatus sp.]